MTLALVATFCSAAAAQVPSPAPATTAAPAAPAGATGFPSIPGLSSLLNSPAPQAYNAFVRTAERQSGLIDILHKDDEVYLDLTAEQLDHPFIIAPVLASGVGQGAFAGRIYSPFVVEFKRVGKRILWISKNTAFVAPPNSAAANALAISTADSVINSSPIVAQDEAKKRIVISASFFLTDYESVSRDLGAGGGGGGPVILFGLPTRPAYSLDGSRSFIEKTKALPKNDEILSSLTFDGPANGPAAATDGRGVRIRMHYSIIDAPQLGSNYVPRFADDRVGYFISAHKRFDDDNTPTPFVRYIDRWNFNNGPIVYYLTNEIPAQYKPAIRAGLLEWNKAFAKAGIPNAVEVRDQPNDRNWDPDDIRYSTVRWLTSDRPAFSAYGPHVADPRTGEILRVSVVIDGENMRAVKRGYGDQVVATRNAHGQLTAEGAESAVENCADLSACDHFAEESAEQAAVGTVALNIAGASPEATERYAEAYLQSVIIHEAGHNLGLRHNFAAAIYPLDKLHDKNFTSTHGLVDSVMHYTPVNLSPPGKPQGDFFQSRLGPYDYWVIAYGYSKFPNVTKPSDEASQLKRLADQSTQPELAYATDEDSQGPRGLDPHVATYLLSSDPFAFYQNQFQVFDDLITRLDKAYPRDDRPYSEERQTFLGMMRQYERASMLATKYIGGLYTSRSHRGQPGGVAPFRPIAREDQRRAFATLSEHVFSSKAMRFPTRLLNDMSTGNYSHRGVEDSSGRPDFAVESYVASLQDSVMYEIFSPPVMSRIADEQLKVARPADTMSLEDLFGWMQAAVYDDVHAGMGSIDPLHRGLQRRYTNYLIEIALAPSFIIEGVGFPGDTAPLARYQLRRLDDRLTASLSSNGYNVATRAHLEDLHNRVSAALKPVATRGD
jgi:hypothetical protein